jgi:hypothetical protein
MKKVTDPALLQELEGTKKVTDPNLLAQLETPQPASFSDDVGAMLAGDPVVRAMSNIPKSAGNMASGIAQAVLHPVDTVKGLWDAAAGGMQNAFYGSGPKPEPGFLYDPQSEATANAVGGFFKDRYGGLRNIGNTMVEDPVGFASDVAGVAGVAGLGLRAAGATKAAQVAQQVSSAIDPLSIAGRTAVAVAKPAYKQVVGMSTGAGARVIDEALKGTKPFTDAMRGKVSEAHVVKQAKDALDDIRQARGDQYRARLENLQGAKNQIPIDDIKVLADDQLKRFNVKKTATGELDFSRSTANAKSAGEIDEIYKLVKDWGSQSGDLTPTMLDVLKRRLDDFYAEGRSSSAMVTTLKKAVQDKIVKSVPEYAEMTKDYAKTTELIKEMESALGAGKRTAADTALRKMIMAVKEDKGFRSDLMKTLGGDELMGAAAGVTMKPLISRSLGSMATSATAGGVALVAASPKLAALMALASPRLVGEFSVLMNRVGKAAPYGRGTGILAYQSGRMPLEQQE